MKYVKGMLTGMLISAGVAMVYAECSMGTNKMLKKGKKMMRRMGM